MTQHAAQPIPATVQDDLRNATTATPLTSIAAAAPCRPHGANYCRPEPRSQDRRVPRRPQRRSDKGGDRLQPQAPPLRKRHRPPTGQAPSSASPKRVSDKRRVQREHGEHERIAITRSRLAGIPRPKLLVIAKRSREPFSPSARRRQYGSAGSLVWSCLRSRRGTNAYGVIVAKLRQSKRTPTDHCPNQLGYLA